MVGKTQRQIHEVAAFHISANQRAQAGSGTRYNPQKHLLCGPSVPQSTTSLEPTVQTHEPVGDAYCLKHSAILPRWMSIFPSQFISPQREGARIFPFFFITCVVLSIHDMFGK